MKSFDTSLLVFEAKSLPAGLVAHEEIATFGDVRILEASVCGGGRFVILATGPSVALEAGLKAVHAKLDPETAIVDQEVLDDVDRSVFDAIHSLTQQRLEQSLVAVETETASGAIAIARHLVKHHSLKPIAIKIRRSSSGAHAYLTGSAEACGPAAEEARTLLRAASRTGSVEWFEKPSQALKSLFDFV
ncbi:MAG: hypothetical protein AAB250_07985 [Bdellovibrionota bacterium]